MHTRVVCVPGGGGGGVEEEEQDDGERPMSTCKDNPRAFS